jgi:hypothetical protein
VGDEISVSFNKDINVGAVVNSNFLLINRRNNDTLPGIVSAYNNKIVFKPTNSLKTLDGDSLQMVVKNVKDLAGNNMVSVDWRFLVVGKELYVTPREFIADVYQGDSISFATVLFNNDIDNLPVAYQFTNLSTYATWISTTKATGSVIQNLPENVNLKVKTKELPVGIRHAYLKIKADNITYDSLIHIKINVLPKTPNWVVNPANYSESMALLTNFNFDNSNIKSTDTSDVISVWIDNTVRGVAPISQFGTNYAAAISVYGNSTDANKALKFRI